MYAVYASSMFICPDSGKCPGKWQNICIYKMYETLLPVAVVIRRQMYCTGWLRESFTGSVITHDFHEVYLLTIETNASYVVCTKRQTLVFLRA